MPTLSQVHLLVSGRVQGVFFRTWIQREANQLGLTGYAKNLPTGQVEILVQGQKTRVGELVEKIKTAGPPLSRVEKVETAWIKNQDKLPSFAIK